MCRVWGVAGRGPCWGWWRPPAVIHHSLTSLPISTRSLTALHVYRDTTHATKFTYTTPNFTGLFFEVWERREKENYLEIFRKYLKGENKLNYQSGRREIESLIFSILGLFEYFKKYWFSSWFFCGWWYSGRNKEIRNRSQQYFFFNFWRLSMWSWRYILCNLSFSNLLNLRYTTKFLESFQKYKKISWTYQKSSNSTQV